MVRALLWVCYGLACCAELAATVVRERLEAALRGGDEGEDEDEDDA